MSEENTPASDSPELGDAGKKAIDAERKRANEAEKAAKAAEAKLKEIEDANKSDIDKALARVSELEAANTQLTTELGKRDLTISRLNVGIDEGLPKNLIARLQGDDEDSIKADAASLRELIPDNTPSPFPKADPSQGAKGTAGKTTNADAFAAQLADAGF